MDKPKFQIIARHRDWLTGCTITESARRDDAHINGISIRRFTATIRGWNNWRIYEGAAGNDDVVKFVMAAVHDIRTRIDNGDENVFGEPNEYSTEANVFPPLAHLKKVGRMGSTTPAR